MCRGFWGNNDPIFIGLGHLLITENAERGIRHYFTPLQIVRQKPNIKNYNEALK